MRLARYLLALLPLATSPHLSVRLSFPQSTVLDMLRSLSHVARGDSFEILPTRSDEPGYRRSSNQPLWKRFYTKRILRLVVFAVLCIGIVHFAWGSDNQSGLPSLPPLYDKYQRAERNLPQHDPDLPPPEGKRGKYLWFANHVHGMLSPSVVYALE